jgi:sterol desaturase/sphingolipid hydroxylase (fatty acid hydroxylase superfamily)
MSLSFSTVLRYSGLTLSAAAMVVGTLVMIGLLVPRYFPEQYRVIVGVVVFLYGAYRFVMIYFRHKLIHRDEE